MSALRASRFGDTCATVHKEDDIRALWSDGAFGTSTRQTRFKPAFLEKWPLRRVDPFLAEKAYAEKRDRIDSEVGEIGSKKPLEAMRLSAVELGYLVSKGKVVVKGGDIPVQSIDRYKTYEYFRKHGWIVKSGAQYGSDFVLYARDPDTCHSRWCVTVVKVRKKFTSRGVLRAMRVAEQTKKRTILCSVDEDGKVQSVSLKRWSLKHDGGVQRPAR